MLTIGLEGEVVSKREMDLWYIVWILPPDGVLLKRSRGLSACPAVCDGSPFLFESSPY